MGLADTFKWLFDVALGTKTSNYTNGNVKQTSGAGDLENFYASKLPGVAELQSAKDEETYWADYKKNTGFTPRYPGMQYSRSNGAKSAESGMNWWVSKGSPKKKKRR